MPLLCIAGLRAFMQRAIGKANRNFREHMANNQHVLSAAPAPAGNPTCGLGNSVSDLVRAAREVRVTTSCGQWHSCLLHTPYRKMPRYILTWLPGFPRSPWQICPPHAFRRVRLQTRLGNSRRRQLPHLSLRMGVFARATSAGEAQENRCTISVCQPG